LQMRQRFEVGTYLMVQVEDDIGTMHRLPCRVVHVCAVEGGHWRYGSFLMRPLTAEQLHALAGPNPPRTNPGTFSQP
jgi:hypothetical protein